MSSALERAIDALSDPAVSLQDALRRLLVVTRRIGAEELSAWMQSELEGYEDSAILPAYRSNPNCAIEIRFDGLYRTTDRRHVSRLELPDKLGSVLKGFGFRQPVAELETLTLEQRDLMAPLQAWWIGLYREYAERGEVPGIRSMIVNDAYVKIPRAYMVGILDRVKTRALDLALSIEDVSPEAGKAGGPTVTEDSRLGRVVNFHLTQVLGPLHIGDGATAAIGAGAIAVRAGDIEGLKDVARTLIDEQGVAELIKAIDQDGGEPHKKTQVFLNRVKEGAYGLVGGVATNAAYDGLIAAIKQAFPGWIP